MAEVQPKKGVNNVVAGIILAVVVVGILVAGYMIWLKPPKPALKMPEAPPPVGAPRF